MKVGLIIPTCVPHEMQSRSWESAAQFSKPETPIIALINGLRPPPVDECCASTFELAPKLTLDPIPERITPVYINDRFTDECDLWQWGLEFAIERGWDWCMFCHDDFAMTEPGWEDDLAQSEGWRVALASWVTYGVWDDQANTSLPTATHIGVCLDSLSFGFNVKFFEQRGCVGTSRFGYGYGGWEPCAYALRNDMAVWNIRLNSDHQWVSGNTRGLLSLGADGHPMAKGGYAKDVLPACVVGEHSISVAGRTIRVAPGGAPLIQDEKVLRRRINQYSTLVSDTATGESLKVDNA